MRKSDDIMQKIREIPSMTYGLPNDFLLAALNNDPEEFNRAWIELNEQLIEMVKSGTEPLMILRQELNALRIICSEELQKRIAELDGLERFEPLHKEIVSILRKEMGV